MNILQEVRNHNYNKMLESITGESMCVTKRDATSNDVRL